MAEEIRDDHIDSEHLEELKNNPPVEPNKDELEDFQYESAKASYDKAVAAWKENVEELEEQLLVE